MKCSRMRCVTKENTIDQASRELAPPVWCIGLAGVAQPAAPPATFRSLQVGTILAISLALGIYTQGSSTPLEG
jgi:hypothetical protein